MDKIFMLKFKNLLKPMMMGFAFKSFAGVINDDELKKVQYIDQRLYSVCKITIQGEKSLCAEEDYQRLYHIIKFNDVFQKNHTLKQKYEKIKEICNTLPVLEKQDVILNIALIEDFNKKPACHVIISIVNKETPKIVLNDIKMNTVEYMDKVQQIIPRLTSNSDETLGEYLHNCMKVVEKFIPDRGLELRATNIKRDGKNIYIDIEITVSPELEISKRKTNFFGF